MIVTGVKPFSTQRFSPVADNTTMVTCTVIAPTFEKAQEMAQLACPHAPIVDWAKTESRAEEIEANRGNGIFVDAYLDSSRDFSTGLHKTGTAMGGFGMMTAHASHSLHQDLKHSSWEIPLSAVLGVSKVLGATPYAFWDMGVATGKQAKHGLWAMLATPIAIVVNGMVHGACHVLEKVGEWGMGSLSGKSGGEITEEITETAALAWALIWGAKTAARGGGGMWDALKFDWEVMPAFQNVAMAEMGVSVDGAALSSGWSNLSDGLAVMMAANQSTNDNGNGCKGVRGHKVGIPERSTLIRLYGEVGRNAVSLATRFQVSRATVYKWFEALNLKELLPIRTQREQPQPTAARHLVTNDELAVSYVRLRCNMTALAEEAGMTVSGIHLRVQKSLDNGPSLLRYVIEVKRGIVTSENFTLGHILAVLETHQANLMRSSAYLGITKRAVLDWLRTEPKMFERVMAEALTRRRGNQTKAAQDLGIGTSTLNRFVNDAGPDSMLSVFKLKPNRPKITQRARGNYVEILAVLRRYGGNLHHAASELGMSLENLHAQFQRARQLDPKGTADINVIAGRPSGFTDAQLREAMANANNNMTVAAKELGGKASAVSRRWKLLNISDATILEHLAAANYDAAIAARQLKIGVNDIFARIRRRDTLLHRSVEITKEKQVIPVNEEPK